MIKYCNYLEQYIGHKGVLTVHIENGTYEFEISNRMSFLETKYMIITVGEDFVVLSRGQKDIESDVEKYDKTVIPLQRFLLHF